MTALGIFLRGLAMGAADAVPGVSGGTIAFLTGIYGRWLAVLTALHPRCLRWLIHGQWATLWRALDGGFALPLVSGIAVSLVSVAHLITYGLDAWPERIWGLFFGLVIAMGTGLLQHIRARWQLSHVLWFLAGLLGSALLALLQPVTIALAWWGWPLAGALALSAMLLPGISGSFLLVLIGAYPGLMRAVTIPEWTTLGLFALGGLCGLIAMAHLLRWIFARAELSVMSLLTGVVFGALVRIWPWQSVDAMGGLMLELPTSTTWLTPLIWSLIGLGGGLALLRVNRQMEQS